MASVGALAPRDPDQSSSTVKLRPSSRRDAFVKRTKAASKEPKSGIFTPREHDARLIGAMRRIVSDKKRQQDEILACIEGLRLALRQGREDLAQPFNDLVARRDVPVNELLTMLNQENSLPVKGMALALQIFKKLRIPEDTRAELFSTLVLLACGEDDDASVVSAAYMFRSPEMIRAERRGLRQALGRGLERQALVYALHTRFREYALLLLFGHGTDLDDAKRARCLALLAELLAKTPFRGGPGTPEFLLLLNCLLEKWQPGQEQNDALRTREALMKALTGELANQAAELREPQALFKIAGGLKQNAWVSDGDLVPVLLPLADRYDFPRDQLIEYALQGDLLEEKTARRRGRRQLLHYRLAVNDWSASCNNDVKAYCRSAHQQLRAAFVRFGGLLANLPNQSPAGASSALASASFLSPGTALVLRKALDDFGTGATNKAVRLLAWKSALHRAAADGLEKMLDTEKDDVRREFRMLEFHCIRDFIEGTHELASMLPQPERQ